MKMGPAEFAKCLTTVRGQEGNYKWMLDLLRTRAIRAQWFPNKLYAVLRRLARKSRPYFIAKTNKGVAFVGDIQDRWSVTSAIMPDFELDLQDFLCREALASPGAYLDIGTNLGIVAATVAIHLADRDPTFAFEPIQQTALRAGATFALNGLTNISLFDLAIGDNDGEIVFFDAPGRSEGASAVATDFGAGSGWSGWSETKVQCRTLDSMMDEGLLPPEIGLIKLDVEGNELKAIRGARKLLARCRPTVLYEYYPQIARAAGWQVGDAADILSQAADYRFQVRQKDSELAAFPPPADSEDIVDIYCAAPKAQEA
jgi:FkbM family methyltransferase